MDNKCSDNTKASVNLKLLPPIDPFRIMSSSSSSSKGKLKNSSRRAAAAEVAEPGPNPGMELLDSDEATVKIPTLENIEASISDITTSETQTYSAHEEGMKKGYARSILYEVCAANHWKPPIFECYKKEGPSHRTMYICELCYCFIKDMHCNRTILHCSVCNVFVTNHDLQL